MERIRNSNPGLRYAMFMLVFLASHSFFNPFGLISGPMGKLIFGIFSILALVYALAYGTNLRRVKYPKKAYVLLMIGIIFSIVMVEAFQKQRLMVTIVATMPTILGYLFFYTMMKLNIPTESIEKTLRWLTVASAIIYLANLLAFPQQIFGEAREGVDMSRGFIRLGVMMIVIDVTYFFYCINRWINDGKSKWLWWIALTMLLIVLSLTRQVILVSFVLGAFYIMKRAKIWRRIVVVLLIIAFIEIVLPRNFVYNTMIELTRNQYESSVGGDEDIRIKAWRFYTTEYQTNNWTYFFGNGVPSHGNSSWGYDDAMTVYTSNGGNGCYRVDVGWAGFYWYFGAFATLGLLIMFIVGIRKKKSPNRGYLTYTLIYIALTALASGPILFSGQIVELSVIFYLVFSKQNTQIYAKNSHNHTQLQ